MRERRRMGEKQGQREGVAHDHQERRHHHIPDRGGEKRHLLLFQQRPKRSHAARASTVRCVRSKNTRSRSGFTSVSSISEKPWSTTALAKSAAISGLESVATT